MVLTGGLLTEITAMSRSRVTLTIPASMPTAPGTFLLPYNDYNL
jgi:hypothetical protein